MEGRKRRVVEGWYCELRVHEQARAHGEKGAAEAERATAALQLLQYCLPL